MGHEGEKYVGSEEDPLSRDWSDQPTILTPEEVEQLRSPAPQRRKLKFLFLFLGLALAVPSVVMLALGIDLKVTVAGINLTPVVFFIVLLVGMSFVAKYFTLAPYPLRENSLTALRTAQYREPVEFPLHLLSYSYSRLAAAALFLVVGIMDLIVLTPYMGNPGAAVFGGTYNGTGTAVVLGGVSFFYPVGIPVLAAGIGLAIYLSVARFVGRFARSEHFWFFHEFRLLAPWLTEVPRADAEAFRYQNTQLGPKVLWPLWILPFSFIVLQYGLPLFNQPRATTNILPTMMTLSAVCALLCCVLLLLWPQDYFEIATKEVLYEMYFAPAINPGEVREKMQAFFGFPPTQTRQTGEESTSNLGQVDTTQRNYTQLVLGGLLLALGIMGAAASQFFGLFFWTAAAAYGVVLLARAFLSDFSDRDGTHVQFDQTTGTFLYSRRFARKFQHVYFPSAQQASLETRPRKLEVIDIAAVAWLLSLGMLQVCLGWRVADLAVFSSVWEAIISTILFVTVGFLFIAYFVIPDAHVVVRSASITYTIPVSVNHGQWGALRHLGTRIRGSMQDPANRKSILLRLGVIAFVVAMTGILAFTPLIF